MKKVLFMLFTALFLFASCLDGTKPSDIVKKLRNKTEEVEEISEAEEAPVEAAEEATDDAADIVADGETDSEDKSASTGAFLRMSVEEAKKQMPMDAGFGITVTDIKLLDDCMMYYATCDEDIIPIKLLKSNKSEMKKELKETFVDSSDSDIKMLVNMCKNAHIGIGYTYIGNKSHDKVIVQLSYKEL